MIDIHSHILNNVDDGSKSLEGTINTLKKAELAGFDDIILTPHYIKGYYDNTKSIIKEKIQELKEVVYNENIIVELYQGNEILLAEETTELLEKNIMSPLANSRYILIELPFSNKMLDLNQKIFEIQDKGYIPILAHPERYSYVQEDPNYVIDIIKLGVLIQSNYGSFIGQYGKIAKQTVEVLMQNHLIHFLGTDTHRQGYVYENINSILKQIINIENDTRYIDEITEFNPRKILNDMPIYVECPDKIIERKKVFFFF